MSLILLGLSTLEQNNGQVPICGLDIRTENCGGNFNCHYRPDVDSILNSWGVKISPEVRESFAMPQKWFCFEFAMFSLWHMKEKAKIQANEGLAGLEMFFERQEEKGNTNQLNKLSYDLSAEETEAEIETKTSVQEIFEYLEKHLFRCYYSTIKPKVDEKGNIIAFTSLICYLDAQTQLEPNKDLKAVFEIDYYLDGYTEINNWFVTKEEETTYLEILNFTPDEEK